MTIGLCHEVYRVELDDAPGRCIVRLNRDATSLQSMCFYAPVFTSLGIRVPQILDGAYETDDRRRVDGYAWQVQEYLEGVDACLAVPHMRREQLEQLGSEIARMIDVLRRQPTDGRFGYVVSGRHVDGDGASSWLETLPVGETKRRNAVLHVLPDEAIEACEAAVRENEHWLREVEAECYFDDMSSKNVLVSRESGALVGVCDVDGVAYGDPLEAVGRIYASFAHLEPQGVWYCDAIADALRLTSEQRRRVLLYALLNHAFWATENGWAFNETNQAREPCREQVRARDRGRLGGRASGRAR